MREQAPPGALRVSIKGVALQSRADNDHLFVLRDGAVNSLVLIIIDTKYFSISIIDF